MRQRFADVDAQGFVVGFYADDIHAPDQIPGSAIAITEDAYQALLAGQCASKRMRVLPDGTPELVGQGIETLRSAAWDRIKAERDRRKAGGVLVAAHWIHSDADSRIQWLGIKDSARDLFAAGKAGDEPVTVLGQPLKWKTLSGDFVAVTAQMGFDVVEATKELDARLFATAEGKRAQMEAAEDPAAYDALAGWPATYGE